ncbi:MAG: flagellar filament capping protein FliD [Planctomycetota bacterium]|jgi:flagellar capping protein FliD|nr:flagellar filament capping protein FliD [Planctomycetota bacterium]
MSFGPITAGNVGAFNAQADDIIRQMLQAERAPAQQIEERRSGLQQQREIFDQASSSISGLQGKADVLDNVFDKRIAESSNPNIVDVSAGAGARPGNYEITVQQLAKAHTLASHRIPSFGTDLLQILGPGQRSFNIVAQGQRVPVIFEIPEINPNTGQPPTNEEVVRIIDRAIRDASSQAGLGSAGFTADTIRDTSESARLVIKSHALGSDGQLFFEDTEGVLNLLGVNPGFKATDTGGGFIHGPEGQNTVRQNVVDILQPVADLQAEDVATVSQQLNNLANAAAQLPDDDGIPLAQSLANVVGLLNNPIDLSESPELTLAFESIADLVDRVDDQAVEAIAREFLRRAADLRGPVIPGTYPNSASPEPVPGSRPELANAFETLAEAVRRLGAGGDLESFDNFKTSLVQLSTEDRADLLQEFASSLNGLNELGRKEGDELTAAFAGMIDPVFDLTIGERSSIAVQFLNIADLTETIGTDTAMQTAAEFRELGDLIESLSQPLSDPLETPFSSAYAVFYVLPPETRANLTSEFGRFAESLRQAGKEGPADVFQILSDSVGDPDIHNNFTQHFNDFATAIGSMTLEDRELVRSELAAFTQQAGNYVPAGQMQLLGANLHMVTQSINDLNTFQDNALQDQMIRLTESLDGLLTDERAYVREQLMHSLGQLKNVFPIELTEGLDASFATFNGAANDLTQEDRNILSGEFARHSGTSLVGRAFDALSSAAYYAGEPGSFDGHKGQVIMLLNSMGELDRQEFVQRLNESAGRLPALIGKDAAGFAPIIQQLANQIGQPVVFEDSGSQFLAAFEGAASATGTFNDVELEEINRYLPELADAIAGNVSVRSGELVQNLVTAGHAFANLNETSQELLHNVLQQVSANLGGGSTSVSQSEEVQQIQENIDNLINTIDNIDMFDSLDAKFTLDGIPITRSANTVSDLIDGVTLRLNNTTDPEADSLENRVVQVNIDNDIDGMLDGIQEFVDAYNGTIGFFEDQTKVEEGGTRGALAGDQDYLRLRLNLRRSINDTINIDGVTNFLRDIGLSIGTGVNDTNNLQLDTNALRAALANDISFVRDLLTHPTNGAATRITDLTDEYLRPNGAISRDRNLLNANIDRLGDRLNIFNDRVDSRETLLRNQFNAIAEQLIELGTQTQALGGLGGQLF